MSWCQQTKQTVRHTRVGVAFLGGSRHRHRANEKFISMQKRRETLLSGGFLLLPCPLCLFREPTKGKQQENTKRGLYNPHLRWWWWWFLGRQCSAHTNWLNCMPYVYIAPIRICGESIYMLLCIFFFHFFSVQLEKERKKREKKWIIIKRDFDAQYFISAGLRRCRHCEFMSARTSPPNPCLSHRLFIIIFHFFSPLTIYFFKYCVCVYYKSYVIYIFPVLRFLFWNNSQNSNLCLFYSSFFFFFLKR